METDRTVRPVGPPRRESDHAWVRRLVRVVPSQGDGSYLGVFREIADRVPPGKRREHLRRYAEWYMRYLFRRREDALGPLLAFAPGEVAPHAPEWVNATRPHEAVLFGYCAVRGLYGDRFPVGRRAFAERLGVTSSAVRAFVGKAARNGFMRVDAAGVARSHRLAYYRLTGEGVLVARAAVRAVTGLALLLDEVAFCKY